MQFLGAIFVGHLLACASDEHSQPAAQIGCSSGVHQVSSHSMSLNVTIFVYNSWFSSDINDINFHHFLLINQPVFAENPPKSAGELGGSGTAFRHGVPALRWNSEAQESALRGSIRTQKAAGWDPGGHGPTVICLLHGISLGISWDFPQCYPYGWSYTHCCDLSPNMYT